MRAIACFSVSVALLGCSMGDAMTYTPPPTTTPTPATDAAAPACAWLIRSQSTYYANYGPTSLVAGDVNGDGLTDLVVGNYENQAIGVMLNTGGGTFAKAVTYDTTIVNGYWSWTVSIALGDINGDGSPDIVVIDENNLLVGVFDNRGDGSFSAQRTFGLGADHYPVALAVGDFNRDGHLDVAFALQAGNQQVGVLKNDGAGSFESPVFYGMPGDAINLVVADFNGDGYPEIASAVGILPNMGDGAFGAIIALQKASGVIGVGDFDGDGFPDIVSGYQANANGFYAGIGVFLNRAHGLFGAATTYEGGVPAMVAIGDFSGDGLPDIAVFDTGDDFYALINQANGSFSQAIGSPFGANMYPFGIAAGDYFGDGNTELAVVAENEFVFSVVLAECR